MVSTGLGGVDLKTAAAMNAISKTGFGNTEVGVAIFGSAILTGYCAKDIGIVREALGSSALCSSLRPETEENECVLSNIGVPKSQELKSVFLIVHPEKKKCKCNYMCNGVGTCSSDFKEEDICEGLDLPLISGIAPMKGSFPEFIFPESAPYFIWLY